MQLTFEQTEDDILDLSKNSLTKSRSLKIYAIVFGIIILFNVLVSFSKEGFGIENILPWIISIVAIVVLWVIIFRFVIKKRFLSSGNKQMMVGKREIELLDDSIKVWTPVAETVYQWSAVTQLGQSNKNYFLYLGKAQAIIVSKSAFKDGIEMEEFEKLVAFKLANQLV